MRPGLENKIKALWEPGKSIIYRPMKRKIKGFICISKKGRIYYRYDKHKHKFWRNGGERN